MSKNETYQTVTRLGRFDAAHRVLHQASRCKSYHGHGFQYELTFGFNNLSKIGGSYAIDFSEIKRVGCQWIDDHLDHGSILNPQDKLSRHIIEDSTNKVWFMSLYGQDIFCNPTVENISKEIFLAMELLMQDEESGLHIQKVKIFETPNCFTECTEFSISKDQRHNFCEANAYEIEQYRRKLGEFEYDARKLTPYK